MIWIVTIIMVLGGISLFINTQFVERYYLSIKKAELNNVYEQIKDMPIEELEKKSYRFLKEESILLVLFPWRENIDELNDELKKRIEQEGIITKKLWLWEEDAKKLQAGKVVNQIYNQGEISYSLLMKYFIKEGYLVVMGSTIPHTTQMLRIINLFTMGIWLIFLVLMILAIHFFVKRTTKPLIGIQELADDIAKLQFRHMEIQTGDELEELTHHLNQMSDNLRESHVQLANKNKAMEELLANVSHELKTPIALIKAYGMAIQDGMDDGTFLETILRQNENMGKLVEQLLNLIRMEQEVYSLQPIDISELLSDCLNDYKIYLEKTEINLEKEIQAELKTMMNREVLECALNNFISNAIKYTANQHIGIKCYEEKESITIEISNGIADQLIPQVPHLWEPFYVGEASRNKELCGTGLGLYSVRKLLDRYEVEHGCIVKKNEIVFYMILPQYN